MPEVFKVYPGFNKKKLKIITFYAKGGKENLEELRALVYKYKNKNIGIKMIGKISIMSHFGELLMINKIPSILIKTN
ncbi:hypothetical protein A2331_02930 [Candidatus Falkowbacteria bacterium RIFOXYB2_FULL_34_18]|uniref:Uncharacterized protein n=1 Tax=Candidatus Falkowbacteria bacterium RIFOXYD2_FULL_34_120 TaxID=1798007 RepID=A0A1F5TMP7_9BACT|nr:MAG: hypothetical protein A2331_02930 [Candidatus Falkowbacteria bacterium RIFOXYB2_FULL_34_18]OGF28334.1 MAG: hypothetical protein A2500_03010 [Candidatus Falkowbacteria bacterium RIFOXYC12_FULL_34_55]OGF37947.1 MAG: hypothetical protein A2466_06075 [Candidatus Falkowbacteria bacterium RIFOXYC2_FULL_34_220]OGF39665.1 MAG: hypothetical protein A2515_07370 [Candidatus Falkowbacteria bacterium RIFOXYD12_FULL_34_57]OGF40104.1 MAG: hypothetical protein A2531_05065 [Candidatus Falkowbacteria bact